MGYRRQGTDLLKKTCTPCQGGIPPLEPKEAKAYLAQAPGWTLRDKASRIEKHFAFNDFKEALDFVDAVGALSETEGHHPDVSFGWGFAIVSWQTKKIKGLHENDFIMAAKVNVIAGKDAKKKKKARSAS
ncbi:MAG: 4a-hydroxytetrahydrobiopterin dehydratase [Alphaproteobacteria bacterium]